ncbi:spore coat protein [Psychrobacillus psychrodurans]|uniref:spore coat protein n=1 Tax=Psychrobacillus psychrodurans TaxID=126157 RepID=UPI0008E798F8|nr:spore coat protein [Psychrobacillus psychrodurans]MCZ8540394.1 spore coat protein [Psychrobacillus psychrodurans]SFM59085.1 spore coat protein X [Psychrobacillus psychrodurans]
MENRERWRALDYCDNNNNAVDPQESDQDAEIEQNSFEVIIIRDSEGVSVNTTDTQVAVSLQIAIQAAIVAVIIATIGDSEQSRAVVQDIKQFTKSRQRNTQRTIVEGSRNVTVTTTDIDVAVNIQASLQILVAIIAKLDIL